jgi:hypothetical protein
MHAEPDPASLYPRDAYAWAQHQSGVLRRLRESGLNLPNDLDLANIIEEIESVGAEQLHAVEGNLTQALLHLVKLAALPEHEAAGHWEEECEAFLANATRRYRPSMRRALDLDDLWSDVRRRSARQFVRLAAPPLALPPSCPLPLEALVDRDADPRALAAALAAALRGG